MGYQWLNNRLKYVGLLLPYKLCVNLEALLRYPRIIRNYSEYMREEWKQLSPYLPAQAVRTLDIGCGIGGINEFLYETYGVQLEEIFLVDKNKIESRIHYGFRSTSSAYNSLSLAKSYLVNRGVSKEVIHTVDVDKEILPKDITFDVILSLQSWGFHYPVQTYLDYAKQHLARRGVLIIDCRKGTDAMETLERHFAVSVIDDKPKCIRVSCQHKTRKLQSPLT
jgi:SAM-dependent methyltransferase